MHDHNHDHGHEGHHHHEVSAADAASGAFIMGIVLNSAYVIAEAVMGFLHHSMSLLSDAGHNLGDVAGLVLSLIAFRLTKLKPSDSFTYGYKKTTILAALSNSVILLVSVGLLSYESVRQLIHPQKVEGGIVAIVAAAGIAVNFGSALFFRGRHKNELNNRGAYLHLMGDAAVSLGVVISGIIIKYTGWYWLDGVTSVLILAVILVSAWSLLAHSLRLTLDAVPADLQKEKISRVIQSIKGVRYVHHMHIWGMSTTENALTAHVALSESLPLEEQMKLVQHIKHELLHQGIHHATIELESASAKCNDEYCSEHS